MNAMFAKTGMEDRYVNWWLRKQSLRHGRLVMVAGVEVFVPRRVFSPDPRLTDSSLFLYECLPDLSGKTVFDIGTGSGCLGVAALRNLRSKRVIATDRDIVAVRAAKKNFRENCAGRRYDVRSGDVFSPVSGRADVVIANLPFIDVAYRERDGFAQDVQQRFLRDLPQHLKPTGAAYIAYASFGDIEAFERKLLDAKDLHIAKLFCRNRFGVNWHVLKLKIA